MTPREGWLMSGFILTVGAALLFGWLGRPMPAQAQAVERSDARVVQALRDVVSELHGIRTELGQLRQRCK